MGKNGLKKVLLIFFIIIFHFMAAYIGLAFYYKNAFEYGTWINGVYCTGKSIEEVNEELSRRFEYEGVNIYDKDSNVYQIASDDIGYQYDFEQALKLYLDRQNSWLWVDSFWKIRDDKLNPEIKYNKAELENCFNSLPFIQQGNTGSGKLAVIKTYNGYELLNERCGILDMEAAKLAIEEAIKNSQTYISLEEAGCYYDMELTEEMREILNEWELVRDFQDCHIVYDIFGKKVPIDASVVCDWILLNEDGSFAHDENGRLMLREGAVAGFIDELAAEYDTVGKKRSFKTTRGDIIEIEGGTYGNKLDKEAETEYLTQAFLNKADEVHVPVYKQTSLRQGLDDIGSTYVEVDMTEQMMYYYLNGKMEIETPIVTGNTSRKMGTPAGVNYVYLKQTDRILRGEGYASHVNFWMPVKGNIGIHDAAWRSKFGGKIYQTNGSHGCINTPYKAMSQIYEMVDVGTPVVMFY